MLGTEIAMLQTSPRTRRICAGLRLRLVDDLLLVGPLAITYNGVIDTRAIREIRYALQKLGIDW